ncbi:DsbA family protein [Jiella pelagia]|uniref:DsbA family protein n=2 Tax=Jiella pelagia TaxID=2986949 RepID=A0ABY7C6T0_9HYPH|nr:DsbA family protein [Jiella pelagia]
MCSWCWGFSPVIDAIARRHPELPIRLVLGGLRPFTDKPMDEQAKAMTRQHWEHVEAASGQPFDFAFFDRQSFIYDTEPAARAVVAARRMDAGHAFPLNRRIAHAFYAENRDVTQPDVLVSLAAEAGLAPEEFAAVLTDDATREETLSGFRRQPGLGRDRFPDAGGRSGWRGRQRLRRHLHRLSPSGTRAGSSGSVPAKHRFVSLSELQSQIMRRRTVRGRHDRRSMLSLRKEMSIACSGFAIVSFRSGSAKCPRVTDRLHGRRLAP